MLLHPNNERLILLLLQQTKLSTKPFCHNIELWAILNCDILIQPNSA